MQFKARNKKHITEGYSSFPLPPLFMCCEPVTLGLQNMQEMQVNSCLTFSRLSCDSNSLLSTWRIYFRKKSGKGEKNNAI